MASACATTPTVASAPAGNAPSPSAPRLRHRLARRNARPLYAAWPWSPCKAAAHGSSATSPTSTTPRPSATLGAISGPVFVSGTEISYANGSGLSRMHLNGSAKTLVVKDGGNGDWSPDGKAVVYTTFTSTDSCTGTTTVHQLKGGPRSSAGISSQRRMRRLPNHLELRDLEHLDFRLLYSPDGSQISLVTTGFSGSSFRIWSSAGRRTTGRRLERSGRCRRGRDRASISETRKGSRCGTTAPSPCFSRA